ncbi:TonB-dependent siderophore receptor [Maricaulaceae bacterium MS644]
MRTLLAGVSAAAILTVCVAGPAFAQISEAADRTADPEDTIVVTGRASALYRIGEIESGKLPIDPLLSTQTIQIINEQLIEDQGARDAQDLYRNLAGVDFFSYAGVTARGFRQEEIFFDGLRGDPYAGFSVPQLFNIERIAYLKGPSGMLYGPGAPGGLFNYVTKKPRFEESMETRLTVGTEARYGAAIEAEGTLSERVAARAGVFFEDRDLPRANADSTSQIVDAGLLVDLGRGELTLQATHYDQDLGANRLRGVPVDDFGRFRTDRRWNHNEPSDFLRLQSTVLQALVDYELTDSLSVDFGLRYNDAEERQQYHEPRGLFPRQNSLGQFVDASGAAVANPADAELVMVREFRDQLRPGESWSAGANAIWETEIAGMANRVLVGADWFTDERGLVYDLARGDNVSGNDGQPNPLGLLNPDYGQTDPSTYTTVAPFGDRFFEAERAGAYLLNELTVDRLILTGGLRFDSFEDVTTQRFDDGRVVSGSAEDEALTYRLGAVYRVTDEVSAFVQSADSFEPAGPGSFDADGNLIDPSEGEIVEGGLRFALNGGRLQGTVAAYHIVRTNIAQADPDPNAPAGALITFGEITSDGFETTIAADITPNWVGTFSYAYNDARITETTGASITNAVGDRFANAPEHSAGFWTRYQFPQINTAIAFGGDYVNVRQSLSGQKVRPYLIFDASLIYETDVWRAVLRADNLFDETYAASGFIDRTGHFPGEPRSIFLEIGRRW